MDCDYPDHVTDLMARVSTFMDAHIYPNEHLYEEQTREFGWTKAPPIMEELKAKARAEAGLVEPVPARQRATASGLSQPGICAVCAN